RIAHETVRLVFTKTSNVGRIHPVASVGCEFDDANVKRSHTSTSGTSYKGCLEGAHASGKALREYDAATEETCIRTIGCGESPVVCRASREGTEDHKRVDDEGGIRIVFLCLEAHDVSIEHIFHLHFLLPLFTGLITVGI